MDAIAQRVATYVRAHPGQGLIEIAKGLGVSTDVLKLPVMKLMAAKQLKTTGQKRGTKYFAGGRGGPRKATRAKPRKKHGKKRGRKGRRSKR